MNKQAGLTYRSYDNGPGKAQYYNKQNVEQDTALHARKLPWTSQDKHDGLHWVVKLDWWRGYDDDGRTFILNETWLLRNP